ncbi:MAG: flippase-like domain-containing protein [Thermoleophilaceae bacterium]|nr:flippase-like domain-containing protein [Thermoleophilaceae bacterium]
MRPRVPRRGQPGRWGRGGTHRTPKHVGWGPSGRWFKFSRPDYLSRSCGRPVPSLRWAPSVRRPEAAVSIAGSKPIGPSSRPRGWSRLAELTARLRDLGRRHRTLITVLGSLATAAVLVFLLAGRRHEFGDALSEAALGVLAVAALLQIVALLARSEAWHLTIGAAGGTVGRRVLYRASSVQVLGGMLNGQLGVAARIAALRHSSPAVSPQVPTLIAAEFPILAVEGILAALASFTLVGPLGLPWWLPIIGIAMIVTVSAGLRHLALRKARELWKGLAVLRSLRGGSLVIGFVLVAVFAQIFRNWLLLHAVGVDASFFDAVAVLIAVSTLMQLPVGPGAGAAAAVLILGSDGVAAAAAAGVLMTVTGTVGGLCFAAWAGADKLWSVSRWGAVRRRARIRAPRPR